MESRHQARVRENYVDLVRNLTTQEVCDFLYQEEVFSADDCEQVSVEATRAQRVRVLLSLIVIRADSFDKFVAAIRHAGFDYLADALMPVVSLQIKDSNADKEASNNAVDEDDIHVVLDFKLFDLREKLEAQTQVVTSMHEEIKQLEVLVKRHSESMGQNNGERYKQTLIALQQLEIEKSREQSMVTDIYSTLLTKERIEDDRVSTLERKDTLKKKKFPEADPPSRQVSHASSSSVGGLSYRQRRDDRLKCVLIGDASVGKSCLMEYLTKRRPRNETYRPTIVSARSTQGTHCPIDFWDTAGTESYDRLRPLAYPDSDVAVLVYSIARRDTLNNVLIKWWPEFHHFCPKTPTLLVGNMKDVRDGSPKESKSSESSEGGGPTSNGSEVRRRRRHASKGMVDYKEAVAAAKEMRMAIPFPIECSAINGEGVQDVMDFICSVATDFRKKKKAGKGLCCFLDGTD